MKSLLKMRLQTQWRIYLQTSLLNRVPCVSCVPYVPAWSTCQRAYVLTCQKRANFSFLRANVPIIVLKTCQFFNLACQGAMAWQFFELACPHGKWRAIFFTFAHQKVCQLFNYFSKELILLYTKHNIFYIFCIFLILSSSKKYCFGDFSEIVKTDYSFSETVSGLV